MPADPGHGPLDAEPEAGVHEGAVLPEVEVPAVRLGIEPLLLDPREQPVVVVLALRAADDLAVALRRQAVVVEHGPGIVGVLLHVERLDVLGVVEDEDRPVVLLGQQGLVVAAEVVAPLDVGAELVELGDGVGVGDPRERRLHPLERRGVALQLLQLLRRRSSARATM